MKRDEAMHAVSAGSESELDSFDYVTDLGCLILESRVPGYNTQRGYGEGYHCPPLKPGHSRHLCDPDIAECRRFEAVLKHMALLWKNGIPLSIEVLLFPECCAGAIVPGEIDISSAPDSTHLLLEQWTINCNQQQPNRRCSPQAPSMTPWGLLQAVRSYLHFSLLGAWLQLSRGRNPRNVYYRLAVPDVVFSSKFGVGASVNYHTFPGVVVRNALVTVSVKSVPRSDLSVTDVPRIAPCTRHSRPADNHRIRNSCQRCNCARNKRGCGRCGTNKHTSSATHGNTTNLSNDSADTNNALNQYSDENSSTRASDESQTSSSMLLGESLLDPPQSIERLSRRFQSPSRCGSPSFEVPERLMFPRHNPEIPHRVTVLERLLQNSALLVPSSSATSSSATSTSTTQSTTVSDSVPIPSPRRQSATSTVKLKDFLQDLTLMDGASPPGCSQEKRSRIEETPTPDSDGCFEFLALSESPRSPAQRDSSSSQEGLCDLKLKTVATLGKTPHTFTNLINKQRVKKRLFGSCSQVPTAAQKAEFRRSFVSATSLVFHARTGLPLTSSPAPQRKTGSCHFDYDSTLVTSGAIKSCLQASSVPSAPDEGVADEDPVEAAVRLSASAPPSSSSHLVVNFEESVLNGRLEPVSTVEGFRAEFGASGSFCPRHITLPVTVFFFSLTQDNDVSPYLAHINLGTKGYQVPRYGTIQVTLFNPHNTVVKMFVVRYDVEDMPPLSQTFIRQRTLYMPIGASENDPEAAKWLRYLIHIRLASSKSGRVFLHTDIRMIVFRKSEVDAGFQNDKVTTHELRSFTQMPNGPQYSPYCGSTSR